MVVGGLLAVAYLARRLLKISLVGYVLCIGNLLPGAIAPSVVYLDICSVIHGIYASRGA